MVNVKRFLIAYKEVSQLRKSQVLSSQSGSEPGASLGTGSKYPDNKPVELNVSPGGKSPLFNAHTRSAPGAASMASSCSVYSVPSKKSPRKEFLVGTLIIGGFIFVTVRLNVRSAMPFVVVFLTRIVKVYSTF